MSIPRRQSPPTLVSRDLSQHLKPILMHNQMPSTVATTKVTAPNYTSSRQQHESADESQQIKKQHIEDQQHKSIVSNKQNKKWAVQRAQSSTWKIRLWGTLTCITNIIHEHSKPWPEALQYNHNPIDNEQQQSRNDQKNGLLLHHQANNLHH